MIKLVCVVQSEYVENDYICIVNQFVRHESLKRPEEAH